MTRQIDCNQFLIFSAKEQFQPMNLARRPREKHPFPLCKKTLSLCIRRADAALQILRAHESFAASLIRRIRMTKLHVFIESRAKDDSSLIQHILREQDKEAT